MNSLDVADPALRMSKSVDARTDNRRSSPMTASTPSTDPPAEGHAPTHVRNSWRGLMVLGIVILAAALGRWFAVSRVAARATVAGAVVPTSVRVLELREEVVTSAIRYSGIVKELQKVELSFRVPGTVATLHQVAGPGGRMRSVHEGDTLAKGTIVARLERGDYERERSEAADKLAIAEARSVEARATTEQAQLDFHRAEQLVQRSAMTVAEFEAARTKFRNAQASEAATKAQADAAKIELEQADVRLRYTVLDVPFAASTIAARYVDAGERVAASQRIFLVIDVSSVVIAFNVPDTLVGRLAIGQQVAVGTEALPDTEFTGVIHKIASMAETPSRTYPIEVRVDQPGGLRPGMVANIHFRREKRAHLVPLTAVAPAGTRGSLAVYRVARDADGQDRVRLVPIEAADVLDNRVAVRMGGAGGLKPGDRVVATGLHRLHDGELVQVIE
jgi:RND family efflux transporter MFP subunit